MVPIVKVGRFESNWRRAKLVQATIVGGSIRYVGRSVLVFLMPTSADQGREKHK